MKVVVIGANGGAMSFSSKLKRLDKEVEIKVFEKGREVSISNCGMPYYIADYVNDIKELEVKTVEDFEKAGIEVNLNHEVKKVDFDEKIVFGDDFEESYDKLVLASGAAPIKLNIPGIDLENISSLRKLKDGKSIKDKLDELENVTVIGGGYIGLEVTEALLAQNKKVTLIEGGPRLLPAFDVEITDLIEEFLEDKIDIHLNTRVEGFSGDGKVEKVLTDKGEFDTEMVIMSIGVRPRTAFLEGIDKLRDGTILINEKMETSIKDVYAVGDCASKRNLLTNEDTNYHLGTYANRQGRMLAENFNGKDYSMPKVVGTNMIKLLELEGAQTGLNESQAKKHYNSKSVFIEKSLVSSYMSDDIIYCKMIYDDDTKKILGAQLLGNEGSAQRINVFALAIERGMTAHELEYSDFGYHPALSTIWDVFQIASQQVD